LGTNGTIVGNSSAQLDENCIPFAANESEIENDPMISITQDIRNKRKNVQRVTDTDKRVLNSSEEPVANNILISDSRRSPVQNATVSSSLLQDQLTVIPIENLERKSMMNQKVQQKPEFRREN
jgi:hypothetical protein